MRAARLTTACGLLWLAILITACQNPADTPPATFAPRPAAEPTALPHIVITPTLALARTQPPITPTPTADIRLITTFAPDVDPLTGEKVSDPAALQRRPLAIKVANSNEPGVRPQSGVSSADLVFEHETEGYTRWTAIFLSKTPSLVGSNRSCRIIDADLPAMYKSLLACSGFSGGTLEFYIKPTEFYAERRVFSEQYGDSAAIFVRTNTLLPPHNLFVNPAALWEEASRRGINQSQDLTGMVFSIAPFAPGRPATHIVIPYHPNPNAEWRYASDSTTCSSQPGCYLRWSDGVAHVDTLNGQQLSAANVVIIYANHVEDPRYLEDVFGGGHYSIQVQIWNDPANPTVPGGRAQVLRDGQVFEGKWSRPGRFDMLTFIDAAGNPIPLKPGLTWFQLVRPDTAVTTQP